jgi:hypothetical protein
LPDITSILRESFLSLEPVTAVKIERRNQDYFVYVTTPVGASDRPLRGLLNEIRKARPGLSVDVFVEDEDCFVEDNE